MSFTYFFNVCRSQATDATSVYFDSRAQDRSMTVEGKIAQHITMVAAP